jgi:hypothetical protein
MNATESRPAVRHGVAIVQPSPPHPCIAFGFPMHIACDQLVAASPGRSDILS